MISEGDSRTSGSDSGFTTDGRDSIEPKGDPSISEERSSKPQGEASVLEKFSDSLQEDTSFMQEHDNPWATGNLYMAGMSEQGEGSEVYFEDDEVKQEWSFAEDITEESAQKEPEEPFHMVILTVTIGFSLFQSSDAEQTVVGEKGKAKQKQNAPSAASKIGGNYHLEYTLLPDDPEPVQADVVVFGAFAKLFMDNIEPKNLKPWYENDRIWLSWSYDVKLKVTKTFLLRISSHIVNMDIWDSKDKLSLKAKSDKSKTVKLTLQETEALESEIQNLVTNHRKLFEDNQPKPSFISNESVDAQHLKVGEPKLLSEGAEISKPPSSSGFYSLLSSPMKTDDTLQKRVSSRDNVAPSPGQKSSDDPYLTSGGRNTLSNVKEMFQDQGRKMSQKPVKEKEDKITLQIDFIPLLAGDKSATQWIKGSANGFSDAFMTLALDAPLMSEEQKNELNPLIIRIIAATSLPTTPVSIQVLKEKCDPVYCRYRFFDLPPHRTEGQKHGTHVYFKDVNVILIAAISPGLLLEYLRGPPIEIEVHDRDRKLKDTTSKPLLFGTQPEDEKLSDVGFVTSKNTGQNPLTERDNLWNPFGIAKVNLTHLLQGEKYLNITAPIYNCTIPDINENHPDKRSGKIMGVMGSVDGPWESSLPMGHYLESNASLKIRVDITVPLTSISEAVECPFGRIIFIFMYNNSSLLHDLMNEVTEINANAFRLDSYPIYLIQGVISAIKLEDEQKENSDLDIITGFHIMDGQIHLFVLEGLKDKAVKRIWEKLSTWIEDQNVKILYNSELSFHQRMYKDLDAVLYHVFLHEPLSCIMKQPLLYVRDMVPHACFQALSRLDFICSAKKIKDVIQGDLLPSAEMITLLSKEFGIPWTIETLFAQDVLSTDPSLSGLQGHVNSLQSETVQLDNVNENYVQLKKNMLTHKNHIQTNINAVKKKVKKSKIKTIVALPADGKSVHNYGFQSLNSSELAKKLLRQEMAKEPRRRFAYNDYLSGTLDPVDLESELKECAAKSKSAWLTPQGFSYPGVKSSIESNQHPGKPHEARVMDLTKKWKEHILHADLLKPVLPHSKWSSDQHHMDFDLYRKCPKLDYTHVNGYYTEGELQKAAEIEYIKWLEKIVVEDTRMKFYRCSTQGELTTKGPKASYQQKKLAGLLKDMPQKFSLRHPSMALKPIPSLAVIERTEDTTRTFGPGQDRHHSLKWNGNIIPRYDMEHKKFEELKGVDFKLYCSKRSFLAKRNVQALTKDKL
ncbi:uncharacterized protein KIAA1257 homolog isoform X2 [Rhinatrema bivittatum]|uniref:uncharacterized protein KIAA1257 homolog isoform X2 n=1 Tax=Rhinatrema bivittatum TaxID=194408 RepID=UPI0011273C18|nr:uncharacterized protein KIAA1257 homolog isoform X2 [Rhinatrema bivittatum]